MVPCDLGEVEVVMGLLVELRGTPVEGHKVTSGKVPQRPSNMDEPTDSFSFSRSFSVFPARPARCVLSVPPSLIPVPYQERGGGVACVRGRVGEEERGERGGARSASGS